MSRKHCVSKRGKRSSGGYARRLADRGLSVAPRMADPRLNDGRPASAKR